MKRNEWVCSSRSIAPQTRAAASRSPGEDSSPSARLRAAGIVCVFKGRGYSLDHVQPRAHPNKN